MGLMIAAGGYYLIAQWPVDLLAARHHLGFMTLPVLDTDLSIAGLGLGLVIAPLTSATLRVVPAAQHGIASAAVVVARMIGMLVGIAALSAWGLYRFNQILQSLPNPPADNLAAKLAAQAAKYKTAFAMQYGEMFGITAIVCIVGAILALFISGRKEHAEEPEDSIPEVVDTSAETIDAPTQALRRPPPPPQGFDGPTHAIPRGNPDQTVRIQRRPPGPPGPPGPAPATALRRQQRSTPRRIRGGSTTTSASSSAVTLRTASQMTALMFLGSKGRMLSQSCRAVMLVVLCSCSPARNSSVKARCTAIYQA